MSERLIAGLPGCRAGTARPSAAGPRAADIRRRAPTARLPRAQGRQRQVGHHPRPAGALADDHLRGVAQDLLDRLDIEALRGDVGRETIGVEHLLEAARVALGAGDDPLLLRLGVEDDAPRIAARA